MHLKKQRAWRSLLLLRVSMICLMHMIQILHILALKNQQAVEPENTHIKPHLEKREKKKKEV